MAGLHKLSAGFVDSARRGKLSPGHYADGGGLMLAVANTGSCSWVFRFQRDGKRRELGLGGLITTSLALARSKAAEMREALGRGDTPKPARQSRKEAHAQVMTFKQCAHALIESKRAGWKNVKHADQWVSTLETYAMPVFGPQNVADIDTPSVLRVIEPLWTTKPETASRLRGRIENILDWATTRGYRSGDNPARWRGHLEHLLAAPSKVKRVQHHPALPWGDLPSFMYDLRQRDGTAARALEFSILTAARSGEVRGATWGEIDLSTHIWTIPATRMKAGREQRVPLTSPVMELLGAIPQGGRGDLLFPGARGAPLSDMSLTAVLRRMQRADITVHGFRSSFRDWAGETTPHPREVIEHALAHQIRDRAEAAYARGDLMKKRRALMNDWASFAQSGSATKQMAPVK